MPNRLAQETSPYLRQHQDNPVDWYPWCDDALELSRSQNKPILLSVGYSACHWCHVMAHECFEKPEIAQLMNEHFINIKVDREERPDLDQVYQNVAQIFTRGGGWPLTVFLTPELKPFYGGTYFPPEDRYGRPGFPRLLHALSDAFRNEPATVAENAGKIMEAIASMEKGPSGEELGAPTREGLALAARQLLGAIDWQEGGLGGAPKFPNAMTFSFLWRVGDAFDIPEAREATLLTLEKMARGGIYDQLGGGFSRYSVDATWSVPHFEKMLYDNGLLLKLYSEVLLAGGAGEEREKLFADVLEETVDYLLREMRSKDGLFYAAQDADSEGEEGKFFVWDPEELTEVLGEEDAKAFAQVYGVTKAGNFEHGKTVLYLVDGSARDSEKIRRARSKLLAARSKRIPPGTDDKVLTAWNGLAISGLVWASLALEKSGRKESAARARQAGQEAFRSLCEKVATTGGKLKSTFQGGQAKFNGYLDDYAFLAQAALDLTRVAESAHELETLITSAAEWASYVTEHFRDPGAPGYFFTSDDHEKLIQRPKTLFDQAIPAGTSVLVECLAILAEIDPNGQGARFRNELEEQLPKLFPTALSQPYGMGELLCAGLLALQGPVVVSGPVSREQLGHPRLYRKGEAPGQSGVLVCHRQACSLPLTSAQALNDALQEIYKKL